jgi:cutinase
MRKIGKRSRVVVALGLAGCAAAGGVVMATSADAAPACSNVEVVFARGTGEAPGLGILGGPLASRIRSAVPGQSVTTYAVNYPADFAQVGDGQGATDLSRHVEQTVASCPDTDLVIGGYSQGASVVDIALGVGGFLGRGQVLSANAAAHVKAVTVFGNPLRAGGGSLETANTAVKGRVLDQCNVGDPVCGGGANFAAHLAYATNGAVTKAAQFAVSHLDDAPAGGAVVDDTAAGSGTSARESFFTRFFRR